ncbi:UNVERIFIED_CONTAM: hypothetical protein K2H54_036484 [Gekko kuhli]
MRILFLLFAILLFVFQAIPAGYAYPYADTLECRRSGGFCKRYGCPRETVPTGGTCQDGYLTCCKSPWRDGRRQ